MKPRVLFVSRERFRLPLDGAQKRKWDAVADVVDHRVLAAAPSGYPIGDEHFHLVGPAQALDGPLFYTLLPWRIARELRSFRPQAALVQGVHETVAFLAARRLVGVETKVILDVQGDWHEATRLYGSSFRRLLNPVNDATAPLAVRGADAVRTVSTQTTGLVRALGVEPAAVFPSYVDADAFLSRPPAPLPGRLRSAASSATARRPSGSAPRHVGRARSGESRPATMRPRCARSWTPCSLDNLLPCANRSSSC